MVKHFALHGCRRRTIKDRVGEWCVRDKFSVYKGYCFLCSKSVACENTGKLQLIQHAQGKNTRKE